MAGIVTKMSRKNVAIVTKKQEGGAIFKKRKGHIINMLSEILKLIKEGESDKTEFKRKITSQIGADVCAFLNTNGGTVLVGVDESGRVYNITKQEQDTLYNILSRITPTPKIKIKKEMIDGKEILVLKVPKSRYLHMFGNIAYIRIGAINRPLTLEEIYQKASESTFFRYDDQLIRATPDWDWELLEQYFGHKVGLNDLEKAGFLEKQKCRVASLLVFSKNPEDAIAGAYVEIKTGEHIVRKKGPLPRLIDEVLSMEYRLYSPKTIRQHTPPVFVIREAVANALIHKNYTIPAPVKIIFEADGLIVENPGAFPPGVSPENVRHYPRNPLVCELMLKLGYVEKFGTGIEKMKRLCGEQGWHLRYEQNEQFTTLYITHGGSRASGETSILLSLLEEPKTTEQLATILGKSKRTVLRELKPLIIEGKVIKIGRGRATQYVLRKS